MAHALLLLSPAFREEHRRQCRLLRISGSSFSIILSRGEFFMLYWAFVFLLVAIVAGALGFGGIAGTATGIAKVLFFIFLVLFIAGLVLGWGGSPFAGPP